MIKLLAPIAIVVAMIACSGSQDSAMSGIADISTSDLEQLAAKKIYFGHQSVGADIIKGMQELLSEDGRISPRFTETKTATDFSAPVFAHFYVGENTRPIYKIEDFTATLTSGIGEDADITFLKLCYVDFDDDTDVKRIFDTYVAASTEIQALYPDITIVHLTAPLTTLQTGLKAWIKKLLKMEVGGIGENIKRQEYNEMLRAKYLGKESFFDIAKIESTKPNGSRTRAIFDGKEYYTLVENYTSDGGHLNETGRRLVAAELIRYLAKL